MSCSVNGSSENIPTMWTLDPPVNTFESEVISQFCDSNSSKSVNLRSW